MVQKRIVVAGMTPCSLETGYLTVRRKVEQRNLKLASHLLVDRLLDKTHSSELTERLRFHSPFFTNAVLVYPPKGKPFKKQDVVTHAEYLDLHVPSKQNLVFEASRIPDIAFDLQSPALLVNVRKIENDSGSFVVIPYSVTVVSNLVRGSRPAKGEKDPKTKLPVKVTKAQLNRLSEQNIRFIYTSDKGGVFPIVRGVFGYEDNPAEGRIIIADGGMGSRSHIVETSKPLSRISCTGGAIAGYPEYIDR